MASGHEFRAAAYWAAGDIRRRWKSLVIVGLLIGLTAGFALSTLAGERRTNSALIRLTQQTHAPDAVVFPSQVGTFQPNWAPLAARPEVAKLAVWNLLFGNVNGQQGGLLFGSADGTYLGSVDKPVVVRGRMFNPAASNEMVLDENAAKDGPPVGATITFQPYAPDQPETTGQPRGPKVTMHVVGVVRTVPQFLFASDGQALVSPGFMVRYGSQILDLQNADVVLRHGSADVGALRRDMNRLVAPGAPVLDVHATSRRVNTTLAVERIALLLLAAAVILGGGILVAQTLGRSASAIDDDALAMRSMGMTRNDLGIATGLSHLVPAVIAGVATFGVALVASDRFPVGMGRRLDPDVGYHIDWTMVGPGIAVTMLALLGASVFVGRRDRTDRRNAARSSTAPKKLRLLLPASAGIGTTMAFESGRGRARVPVVPALLAAVVAVVGVVATLGIDRGISSALDNPNLAGVAWDAGVTPNPDAETGRNISPQLARLVQIGPVIKAAAIVDRDVLNVGRIGVPTFSVRPVTGESSTTISFTRTSGRAPRGLREAAIGPATARELHVAVGDTITIGTPSTRVQIVGESLFPDDVHAEFDEGLWLAPKQFDAIVPPIGLQTESGDARVVAVRFGLGTDLQSNVGHLRRELGPLAQDVAPPHSPDELTNLGNVRALPHLLAVFLGLIAVAALGSVLMSSTRMRQHDFAVFRALGMTRGGVRLVLSSQATAIALFGVTLGIPLGLAAGRIGWRTITERVPLSDVAPLALVGALLLVPATIIVANLLALWPGRVALSRVLGKELRSE